jgi:hypothetical protein
MLKRTGFEHDVYVRLQFTAGDLRVLRHFAELHYDHDCKTFFVPGPRATGNGWRHFSFDPEIDPFDEAVPANTESEIESGTRASFDDLDRCMKILEGHVYEQDDDLRAQALRLRTDITALVEDIRAEHKRIRGGE